MTSIMMQHQKKNVGRGQKMRTGSTVDTHAGVSDLRVFFQAWGEMDNGKSDFSRLCSRMRSEKRAEWNVAKISPFLSDFEQRNAIQISIAPKVACGGAVWQWIVRLKFRPIGLLCAADSSAVIKRDLKEASDGAYWRSGSRQIHTHQRTAVEKAPNAKYEATMLVLRTDKYSAIAERLRDARVTSTRKVAKWKFWAYLFWGA